MTGGVGAAREVLQQDPRDAVVDVLGEVERTFRAFLVAGTRAHLVAPGVAVERGLARSGERLAMLDQPIGEQPKYVALREGHGLVIERSVFEPEDHTTLHDVLARRLHQLAIGENLPVVVLEREERVGGGLGKAHRGRRRPPQGWTQREENWQRKRMKKEKK